MTGQRTGSVESWEQENKRGLSLGEELGPVRNNVALLMPTLAHLPLWVEAFSSHLDWLYFLNTTSLLILSKSLSRAADKIWLKNLRDDPACHHLNDSASWGELLENMQMRAGPHSPQSFSRWRGTGAEQVTRGHLGTCSELCSLFLWLAACY